MNARLHKEFRQLLPAWCLAMLLAASPLFLTLSGLDARPTGSYLLRELTAGTGVMVVALSALCLTFSSFGVEFSNRTFLLLLAQPVSRARVWREKIFSLGIAAGTVGAVFLLSVWACAYLPRDSARVLRWSPVLFAVAFGGGLWTSLLFRQFVPALVFAILIPSMLAMTGSAVCERFFPVHREAIVMGGLLTYAALGVFAARRIWLRAQDFHWLTAELSFGWKTQVKVETRGLLTVLRASPPTALLRKELHLQMPAIICAVVYLIVCALVIGLTRLIGGKGMGNSLYEPAILLCIFLMPLLTGALAFAEERRLGTLESFCGLPVSRARQFVTKLVVAYGVGLCLGGVVPWCLKYLVAQFVGLPAFAAGNEPALDLMFVLGPLAVTTLALYASSLTSTSLTALGSTLALGAAGILLVTSIQANASQSNVGPRLFGELVTLIVWKLFGGATAHQFGYLGSFHYSPLLGWVAQFAIPGLLLWLAYLNYSSRRGSGRLWLRNLRFAVIYAGVIYVLAAATYLRVWEFAMPRNPTLGAARLDTTKNPKLVGATTFVAALLPDGRIWKCDLAFGELSWPGSGPQQLETPTSRFLTGSNWADLTTSGFEIVGLQQDGSLWLLEPGSLAPSRIGTDYDWKTVSGGSQYFLAVKQDGSLWSWPSAGVLAYGPSPNSRTSQMCIGSDTNWVGVHSAGSLLVAVKADGTVWRWGTIWLMDDGNSARIKHMSVPELWLRIPWSDFKACFAAAMGIVIERADGSYWINHSGTGEQWVPFDAIKNWRAQQFGDWEVLGVASDGVIRRAPMLTVSPRELPNPTP